MRIILPLLLCAFTFLISAYFATIGVDAHHDGIMFKPALDVAHGKQLFRETFTQYGALTTLLQAASIKIFGEYLIVIRLLTAFFYGLIAAVLYFVWRSFLAEKLALLGAFLFPFLASYHVVAFLPWASVQALFFQSLAFLVLVMHSKNSYKSFL